MSARLRQCKSAGHPLTCRRCEVTIAYEEQSLHSTVVNDMNKNLTADELLNFRQKKNSFYKQDCHHVPKIKSMTASGLCNKFNAV